MFRLTNYKMNFLSLPISLLLMYSSQSVKALEVVAGDYEILPDGVTVGLQYLQYADRSKLYANGDKVASNFNFSSTIGLSRIIKPFKINEKTYFDLNVILPYGKLKGENDAAALGSGHGVSDLIIGGATKFLLDPQTKDVFSIGTYLYLPTGSYDHKKALNLGENRWKGLVQLAYIKHFNADWAIDAVADVLLHGKNDNFGLESATLKQKPRYELQGHLRYNYSAHTALTLGVGNIRGGKKEINNKKQNDELNTVYGRVGVNHWFSKTSQIQFQFGKDLSVYNGPKEDLRFNLRLAHVF